MPPIRLRVYFNDNEPFVCRWLKNLYPHATIDQRSIAQVTGEEISHDRVHLFAGIGGWEYALSLAGWPEFRPVWTGSCPCTPFSSSGKRRGTKDARHLWPEMLRLVQQHHPPTVFGEQVASPLGRAWLAGVRNDLETIGYAVGAVDLPACCVGAPHIRQRLFWVATNGRLAHTDGPRHAGHEPVSGGDGGRSAGRSESVPTTETGVPNHGLEHTAEERPQARQTPLQQWQPILPWREFEVLPGVDGSFRRIEPSVAPLVDGIPRDMGRSGIESLPILNTVEARVGRLMGYGNSIVP